MSNDYLTEVEGQKYIIVQRANPRKFMREVNEAIEKGWTPLGGVSCLNINNAAMYTQSLIRLD